MNRSFVELMDHIIDYAGLFPPAKLPMEEAIQNFVNYLGSDDAWMLSRFICPASRLDELSRYGGNLFRGELAVSLSILTSGGDSEDLFLNNLHNDLDQIDKFLKKFKEHNINVDFFETRFTRDIYREITSHKILRLLNDFEETIESDSPTAVMPFFEAIWNDEWQLTIPIIVEAIAAFNKAILDENAGKKCLPAGFKIRCGGETPEAFPEIEKVAYAIKVCRENRVPLKATAGLHHPFRHFNKEAGSEMHGFINLFGAALLNGILDLDMEIIERILNEKESGNFVFEESAFRWNDFSIAAEQIREARRNEVISFGSCSFDEPREDLRNAGLLD